MKRYALDNFDRFEVLDSNGLSHLGGDQDWYRVVWRRMAGCGPTTSSNIALYLERENLCESGPAGCNKKNFTSLMDRLWEYVTPTMRGVNNTKILYEGLTGFFGSIDMDYTYQVFDVSEKADDREDFRHAVDFIKEALEKDLPVAFLNLNNGKEKRLESWHWVTLTGLTVGESGNSVCAHILDNGKQIDIDLKLWYETSSLGGGFVYMDRN